MLADFLNKSLNEQEIKPVLMTLRDIVLAQNVTALARETGLRRDKLYKTFGGRSIPPSAAYLGCFGG